jgi:parvulin-like peptidyl-prolyl cis-trans isomerase-like protein
VSASLRRNGGRCTRSIASALLFVSCACGATSGGGSDDPSTARGGSAALPSAGPPRPIESPIAPDGDDLVVGSVDGVAIHASEAFRILTLNLPDESANAVRQIVIDRIAAAEAAEGHITVPEAAIAREFDRVLADQDRKVRESSKGKLDLAAYVKNSYGLEKADYEAIVRASVSRSLLLERVILFELSHHPRIQVRLIRVKDKSLAEEIRKKLAESADFATLARQHSEDGSARDGGIYPPLPSDLPSTLFTRTDAIKNGEIGPVEEVSTNDGPRYRIVQVLTRLPAESGAWTERSAAIEQVLEGRPLSPLEVEAWMRVMEQRRQVRILQLGALTHGS